MDTSFRVRRQEQLRPPHGVSQCLAVMRRKRLQAGDGGLGITTGRALGLPLGHCTLQGSCIVSHLTHWKPGALSRLLELGIAWGFRPFHGPRSLPAAWLICYISMAPECPWPPWPLAAFAPAVPCKQLSTRSKPESARLFIVGQSKPRGPQGRETKITPQNELAAGVLRKQVIEERCAGATHVQVAGG